MSLDRFHAAPDLWEGDRVSLASDEAHHCTRVMRKRPGDRVEVFDGRGRWGRGSIVDASEGSVQVALAEEGAQQPPEPAVQLAVGVPKGKTMELVVQKAVELGVAAIQPLVTEHTMVRLDSREASKKAAKWQRVALEACKQCGQNVLPTVAVPCSLETWLQGRPAGVPGLIGSLADGAVSLRDGIAGVGDQPAALDLLIGPEGDFSGAETASALAGGFIPVTLGEITLRVETAVLFCLSVLNYELRR